MGITKAEFMAQYDPTTRVRNQLKAAAKMVKPGLFAKDFELRREVGCADASTWTALASDPTEGFAKYRFSIDNVVWWTDAKSRDEMLRKNRKAKEV